MDVTVKKIEEVEPYGGEHAIPGIRFRPLRQALGVESWGMNIIELDRGCARYPAHDHEGENHEEVYVVLRGSIVVVADGKEHVLAQGDCARVAPKVVRKIITRDEGATVLALGGTPGKPYALSRGRLR